MGEDGNKKEVVPVQNENDWLTSAGSWKENVSVTLQQMSGLDRSDIQGPVYTDVDHIVLCKWA